MNPCYLLPKDYKRQLWHHSIIRSTHSTIEQQSRNPFEGLCTTLYASLTQCNYEVHILNEEQVVEPLKNGKGLDQGLQKNKKGKIRKKRKDKLSKVELRYKCYFKFWFVQPPMLSVVAVKNLKTKRDFYYVQIVTMNLNTRIPSDRFELHTNHLQRLHLPPVSQKILYKQFDWDADSQQNRYVGVEWLVLPLTPGVELSAFHLSQQSICFPYYL